MCKYRNNISPIIAMYNVYFTYNMWEINIINFLRKSPHEV